MITKVVLFAACCACNDADPAKQCSTGCAEVDQDNCRRQNKYCLTKTSVKRGGRILRERRCASDDECIVGYSDTLTKPECFTKDLYHSHSLECLFCCRAPTKTKPRFCVENEGSYVHFSGGSGSMSFITNLPTLPPISSSPKSPSTSPTSMTTVTTSKPTTTPTVPATKHSTSAVTTKGPHSTPSSTVCQVCEGPTCQYSPVVCPPAQSYCMNVVSIQGEYITVLKKSCASYIECFFETALQEQQHLADCSSTSASLTTTSALCRYCCSPNSTTKPCNTDAIPHITTMFNVSSLQPSSYTPTKSTSISPSSTDASTGTTLHVSPTPTRHASVHNPIISATSITTTASINQSITLQPILNPSSVMLPSSVVSIPDSTIRLSTSHQSSAVSPTINIDSTSTLSHTSIDKLSPVRTSIEASFSQPTADSLFSQPTTVHRTTHLSPMNTARHTTALFAVDTLNIITSRTNTVLVSVKTPLSQTSFDKRSITHSASASVIPQSATQIASTSVLPQSATRIASTPVVPLLATQIASTPVATLSATQIASTPVVHLSPAQNAVTSAITLTSTAVITPIETVTQQIKATATPSTALTSVAYTPNTVQVGSSTSPDTTTATQTTTTKKVPAAAAAVQCAVCTGPIEICELAYSMQTCSPPDNYCLNTLFNNADGTRLVMRKCGNYATCYREWYLGTSDVDRCLLFDPQYVQTLKFQCTFCCTKDNCNKALVPSRDTLFKTT